MNQNGTEIQQGHNHNVAKGESNGSVTKRDGVLMEFECAKIRYKSVTSGKGSSKFNEKGTEETEVSNFAGKCLLFMDGYRRLTGSL